MGTFLSLSGIIGKTHKEVTNSLLKYVTSVNGGFQEQENITTDDNNCCVIEEANGNTTILYPDDYAEWDASSQFMSKDLRTPVFAFHIHDGDFWMYVLFVNGKMVDRFNPIPDYWEDVSEEEIDSWKGNAVTVSKFVSEIKPTNIKNYLVRWDLEAENNNKAYPDDEFTNEDWQLVDFMKKLKFPYPLDDGNITGQTYILWTKDLSLEIQMKRETDNIVKKPWWKLW